jgi:hypothetical protein
MSSYLNLLRIRLLGFVACFTLVAMSQPVPAANTGLPEILSIDFNGPNLSAPVHRWSIDDGTVLYDVPTGHAGFGDMTRDIHGRYLVYLGNHGGSFTETPALYQVHPNTGAIELLVESESAAPHVSLTWLPDGDLLGYNFPLGLLRIDPDTLAYTQIPLNTDSTNMLIGGLATASDGTIYALGSGGDGAGGIYTKLFTIDIDAGTATEIGGMTGLSVGLNFNDIAFAPDGRLIGFTEINAPLNGGVLLANSAYEIDLQTGLPIFLAEVGEIAASMRGFEFVPEPGTLATLFPLLLLAPWRTAREADRTR